MDAKSRVVSCESMCDNPESAKRMYHETQLGVQLHDDVFRLVGKAVVQTTNKVAGMLVAVNGVIGGLHLLARIMAAKPKGSRGLSDTPLTPTQVLFAALFTYHSAPYEKSLGESISEYSPLIVVEALKDFEKLTGRRPDEELDEDMCKVCREFAAEPKNHVKTAALRAKTFSEMGHTIN